MLRAKINIDTAQYRMCICYNCKFSRYTKMSNGSRQQQTRISNALDVFLYVFIFELLWFDQNVQFFWLFEFDWSTLLFFSSLTISYKYSTFLATSDDYLDLIQFVIEKKRGKIHVFNCSGLSAQWICSMLHQLRYKI